jgi:hypothetical protein
MLTKLRKMPGPIQNDYYYIDPKLIVQEGCGGKDFLREQIDTYISTIKCMNEITRSCIDNYELDNLKHCLLKLRSSMAELSIHSLARIIDKLISGAENAEPKEKLTEKLKDFLLICELVIFDLTTLKHNEGILE